MPVEHSSLPLLGLAVLSGLGFGALGIAYRLGQAKGLSPAHIAFAIGVAGSAVFGSRALGTLRPAPAPLWVFGVAFGATQYLVVRLIKPALARGPLSALWCAVNLGFIVAVLYSRLFLSERPSVAQYVGIAAAAACVVIASLGQQGDNSRDGLLLLRDRAAYGFMLTLILALNGLSPVFIKYLNAQPFGAGQTYLSAFTDLYYLLFYGSFAVLTAADLAISGGMTIAIRGISGPGALGALGSVVGLWAWARASDLPAAVVFTVTSVVSIAVAAVVSVVAFRERASVAWYATIGLAALAVVLTAWR